MRRVSVVGAPGSGKTDLARQLSAALGVPHVELDSIFHQAGWRELPRDEFRDRVRQELSSGGWVVDGNYSAVRDLVRERADTVVWLDLPRSLVMRRVISRTIRRALTRERLWNGNREPLTNFYRLDPEANIIRWTWVNYGEYAERYDGEMRDSCNAHIRFVRLRSPQEIDDFLARAA